MPYTENGERHPFYIDFIVLMKDGRIGLFDTKAGITAETAGSRAEGLSAYIAGQNKKGKKLWGGIVVPDKKSWRYCPGKGYSYNPKDFKGWDFLVF